MAVTRTIFVDHHDLDNVAQARSDIEEQIRVLEADSSSLETPISVSLDLQHLRQSGNPEQRSLADLLSEISAIRSILAEMEERSTLDRSARLTSKDVRDIEERLLYSIDRMLQQSQITERRRSISPSRIMEIVSSTRGTPVELIALPVVLSFIKDEVVWLYELGMDAHKQFASRKCSSSTVNS